MVIPAGDGAIAEWVFDVSDTAEPGRYPLRLRGVRASNGPVDIPLTSMDGEIVIVDRARATPTRTPPCPGDCDADGMVSIAELIRSVNIALGRAALDQCPPIDTDENGTVSITDLVRAVSTAVDGCTDEDGP